ncbi:uncharacterized protein LOC129766260 [Toxorhynchites rutilus septentrionalis]|uniref:uncharacterized protein LOC129766260 n=1 Tax=Toxorhynchites rutilus septentrionalis TaxID=329112 RepID=UPI00247A4496|nr:uncharacterized protein LOC129766260 [Toxorhynchites rutilus septentrionalis]
MTIDGVQNESNPPSHRNVNNLSALTTDLNVSLASLPSKQQTPAPSGQSGSTPRPALLYYCPSENATAVGDGDQHRRIPQLLVRQVNWKFYDYPQPSLGRESTPPVTLLPQTEEALKVLREIDNNIAAVGRFDDHGFSALLDEDNCDGANWGDNMSNYLRNGPRSIFFNQHQPTSQFSDPKSDTDSTHQTAGESSGRADTSSFSSDSGRMLKRPPLGNNVSPLVTAAGNHKSVVAPPLGASNLYSSRPPRIIGSTSSNFGGISNRISADIDANNSSKAAFRPSPTSSTATTTPSSTAPGSGTHQPSAGTQMPGNRHSGTTLGGSTLPNYSVSNKVKSTSANNNVHHSEGVTNNYNGEALDGKASARIAGVPQQAAQASASGVQLTLYGWRKKCLYTVIMLLMVMIIINLALTLWILKVMEFSSDGMGQLKIVSGGIQLTGQAMVLDILRASTIRSKHGQPISIESSRNFSLNTRNSEGYLENQLFLGHDRMEILANHFRVADTHGTVLFSVDRDEVTVGASSVRVEGEGGVYFKDSIQTPLVRAEAGKDLKLESPTRSLEARATQEIFIQSRAGSIEANCLSDLKLHSVAGSIRLDASNIVLPNLKTVQPLTSLGGARDHAGAASASSAHNKIYQLCVCSNGKLFLAPAHSICAADDSAICR